MLLRPTICWLSTREHMGRFPISNLLSLRLKHLNSQPNRGAERSEKAALGVEMLQGNQPNACRPALAVATYYVEAELPAAEPAKLLQGYLRYSTLQYITSFTAIGPTAPVQITVKEKIHNAVVLNLSYICRSCCDPVPSCSWTAEQPSRISLDLFGDGWLFCAATALLCCSARYQIHQGTQQVPQ